MTRLEGQRSFLSLGGGSIGSDWDEHIGLEMLQGARTGNGGEREYARCGQRL